MVKSGVSIAGPGEISKCWEADPCCIFRFQLHFILWFGICSFSLTQSQFGRDLYAIGGNREAARLANIPVASREWAAYVLCSALSAFSGMILASRLNTGSPIVGQDLPLQAIAAVVLGGTSLYGGRGVSFKLSSGY